MTPLARRHLLLLPAPLYGLYIPMLEFAKKAVAYHDITMIIMQSKLEDTKAHRLLPPPPIRWIPFRDNVLVEVGADITIANNTRLQEALGETYRTLINCIPTSKNLPLSSEYDIDLDPVDVVFADRFLYTVLEGCHERKIPFYAFCFLPTTTALNMLLVTENSPATPDLYMDDLPVGQVARKITLQESMMMQFSQGLLLNCYESMDEESAPLLKKAESFFRPPINFVGPMISPENDKNVIIEEWLDNQGKASVIYFSFGSVLSGEPEQIREIATALTNLKRPFIWSLHKEAKLPTDLTRSTLDAIDPEAPYLVLSWLKQKEVLSHPSIGIFVSHCGYNSVLEAMYYGVPMVAWPLFGDEHLNAKFVERKGFGKSVADTRLENGRVVPAKEIEDLVLAVAGWGETGDSGRYRKEAELQQADVRIAVGPKGPSTRQFLHIMDEIGSCSLRSSSVA